MIDEKAKWDIIEAWKSGAALRDLEHLYPQFSSSELKAVLDNANDHDIPCKVVSYYCKELRRMVRVQ